jgi:hypothetical protein
VRHSSCLEIKRVFAEFQALGAARTKRRESGQISRESVALPEIPSKPGQIFEQSSRAVPAMALRLFPLGTRRNNAFWLSLSRSGSPRSSGREVAVWRSSVGCPTALLCYSPHAPIINHNSRLHSCERIRR